MGGKKFIDDKYVSGIWPKDIEEAKRKINVGDKIKIVKYDSISGTKKVIRMVVKAVYPHIILLEKGASLTNAELVMYLRLGRRPISID